MKRKTHTKYQFIHAADLHLDSALRGLERYQGAPVEEIRRATRRAFDNLLKLAIEQKVAFVVLAGDLFDGDWPDYNTGLYFVACMNQLRQAQIRVFIISGNHDAASHTTRALRLPDNVHVFPTSQPQTEIMQDLSCAVHGQGFATRAVTDDLSLAYPEPVKNCFNIALLHTCLDGKAGHAPYAPCRVDGLLAKGYDYWALGHVHKHEIIHKSPWIVFPGNIQGRHIRETGSKGCMLVSVDKTSITEVEYKPLDVLRWSRCALDISGCQSMDGLFASVRQLFVVQQEQAQARPLALRLVLKGQGALHTQLHLDATQLEQECRAIANECGRPPIWLQKIELQTSALPSAEDQLALQGVVGALQDSILQHASEGGAEDLLSDDISTLLRRLPREAHNEDLLDLQQSGQRKQLLAEVENLLLSELSQAGSQ